MIKEIENKTQAQAEKILANESDLVFAKERLRVAGQNKTQLTVVLDDEVLATVNKIKSLLSHKYPHANYNDIIKIMGAISLEKLDPSRNKRRKSAPQRSSTNLNKTQDLYPLPQSASFGKRHRTNARIKNPIQIDAVHLP